MEKVFFKGDFHLMCSVYSGEVDNCIFILSLNYLYTCHAEANQEKIVEAGGLGSLLNLLQSSEDETIRRVAAGAVANLAMNGEAYMFCSSCMTHAL